MLNDAPHADGEAEERRMGGGGGWGKGSGRDNVFAIRRTRRIQHGVCAIARRLACQTELRLKAFASCPPEMAT